MASAVLIHIPYSIGNIVEPAIIKETSESFYTVLQLCNVTV